VSRLPVRLRLTVVFAAALAGALAVTGLLLYLYVAGSLDRTIDDSLRNRSADVTALIAQADHGLLEAPQARLATGGGFAQVIDARGHVVDGSRGATQAPLLAGAVLARAKRAPLLIRRTSKDREPVRILATPVRAQDQRLVVVVGTSLRQYDASLATLRRALLLGSPLALAALAVLVYAMAATALRPVERMRSQAARLSADGLEERLSVPAARDELSRLAETLNELLSRLAMSVDRERRFVADASHELRTPLALLRAEIELALDRPRPPDELAAALRSAGDETDRLTQLAEDLLLLARLQPRGVPIRTAWIDAHELLGGIASRFRQRIGRDGRTIEIAGETRLFEADRLRLEHALSNLLENALRHGAGRIRLTAGASAATVSLQVSDQGPGFPDEFLPHAFERFAQADQSRHERGTGLGLAIVAAIVEAHGGTVTAANQPGGGAIVRVSIPAEGAPSAERSAVTPVGRSGAA
jgi:two-component system OmpR family sensor kinase